MNFNFYFPGEPKAIQSVRAASIGGHIKTYQPKENREWKGSIRVMAFQALPADFELLDGAVSVRLTFCFLPPKSWSRRKRLDLTQGRKFYKTTKPDLTDNLCKGLIDSLTGIVWTDDARICKVESEKIYAEKPGISVVVETLEGEK